MNAETLFEIVVPGKPRPAPRVKVTSRGRYYPRWYDDAREAVAVLARQAMIANRQPIQRGHVEVEIIFSGAASNADIDNLVKTVLDGLSLVLYTDDRQVAKLVATRLPNGAAKAFTKITARPWSYVRIARAPAGVDEPEPTVRR